jgi:hypothetical protein
VASPELPFMAAGAISIVGGVKREGHFPSNGLTAVIGTVVLVIFASATANTKVAPLVHAMGLLVLLGATFGTVRKFQAPAPKPVKVVAK